MPTPEVLIKVKDFTIKYGIPVATFAAGYFSGDIFKLQPFVAGLIPADVKISGKVVSIILAAVLLGVAVMLWSMFEGFGPGIGGFLAGMAVNLLVVALKGA